MKYSKDALGSYFEITIWGTWENNDLGVPESLLAIETFERKYSRFINGNILSDINTEKKYELEPEISALIRLSQKVSHMTEGSFDMTLLPLLENAGYGIQDEVILEQYGYKNIDLEGNTLTLHNDVSIEFGACGKGYLLDLVYRILEKYHTDFILNFWGDIRIKGEQSILLEDPLDTQKHIWTIEVRNGALASSSGNRRKTHSWHHLIDVRKKHSQDDKIALYVTHPLWVFADIFATALFVTPLKKSLEILETTDKLEALIIWKDGKIYKSEWFNAQLNI